MVESTGATSTSETGSTNDSVYAGGTIVSDFNIEDARALTKPSERILCTLADNKYIRFGEYSVCDYDTRTPLLSVSAEQNKMQDEYARQMEEEGTLTMDVRTLKHEFPRAFFNLRNLELNLEFTNVNGDEPL